MSGIFGVFNRDRQPLAEAALQGMSGRSRARGASRADVWHEGGAALGVARHSWEFSARFAGPVLVVHDETCSVVADASLYYRDDLRRRLAAAGERPTGQTASHLILAAYRAWGEDAPTRLEGDFAFVVWDRRARRVFCARDFVGSRPLYWAELGTSFVVASDVDTISAHPDARQEFNPAALAIEAAGLVFSAPAETCLSGIFRVEGGGSVARDAKGRVVTGRHWAPVVRAPRRATSIEDGAQELRSLLQAAVVERMDAERPTAMWMSGGWDSPAAFAAGRSALGVRAAQLRPISLSFPEGDRGREDEKIAAIADRWNTEVDWLPAPGISMLDGLFARSARRGEAVDHLFVATNVALAERTRAMGAHVALDGNGGDVIFATAAPLADWLARLQLVRLTREWRALSHLGYRPRRLLQMAVVPNVPLPLLGLAARLRRSGVPPARFERSVPPWIESGAVRKYDLRGRARAGGTVAAGIGRKAVGETKWFLGQQFYPRSRAVLTEAVLDVGVELRTPLLDRRVVEFAVARPPGERSSLGESKLLLRKSMEGLLPPEVLASRPIKTGTLNDYYRAGMAAAESAIHELIARPMLLAEHGIVDARRFRRYFDACFRTSCTAPYRGALLQTLLVELWLRERVGKAPVPEYVTALSGAMP